MTKFIMILLVVNNLFAADISGHVEAGSIPQTPVLMLSRDWSLPYVSVFYIAGEVTIVQNWLFVRGNIKTVMTMINDAFYFDPIEVDYNATVGMVFDSLEMGFRHFCCHPIITYIKQGENITTNYEGYYEELYIRLSF